MQIGSINNYFSFTSLKPTPEELAANKEYIKNHIFAQSAVLNRETKKPEKVILTKAKDYKGDIEIKAFSMDCNKLGEETYTISRENQTIKLTSLKTDNDGISASPYKGVGAILVQQACKDSKECGYGGRITLQAFNIFKKDGSEGDSPTPFFYKLGFRFLREEYNNLMETYLRKKHTDHEKKLLDLGVSLMPHELEASFMQLSEANALKLIG